METWVSGTCDTNGTTMHWTADYLQIGFPSGSTRLANDHRYRE